MNIKLNDRIAAVINGLHSIRWYTASIVLLKHIRGDSEIHIVQANHKGKFQVIINNCNVSNINELKEELGNSAYTELSFSHSNDDSNLFNLCVWYWNDRNFIDKNLIKTMFGGGAAEPEWSVLMNRNLTEDDIVRYMKVKQL